MLPQHVGWLALRVKWRVSYNLMIKQVLKCLEKCRICCLRYEKECVVQRRRCRRCSLTTHYCWRLRTNLEVVVESVSCVGSYMEMTSLSQVLAKIDRDRTSTFRSATMVLYPQTTAHRHTAREPRASFEGTQVPHKGQSWHGDARPMSLTSGRVRSGRPKFGGRLMQKILKSYVSVIFRHYISHQWSCRFPFP